ncbi:MAG TPA: nucleoside monophosphate kinase [Patescibacteria group bacterium]|nr:nucleoside monophosphate kinase [Patescibacteria group bacterium]
MRKKAVIFLGPPGSGKGTQAHLLSEETGMPHISMGEILRQEKENNTELGRAIKDKLDQGELISDDLAREVIYKKISRMDIQNGFILDGFPRRKSQLSDLDNILQDAFSFLPKTEAVYIRVGDEEVKRRLSGRRICDNCGANYHTEFNPPKKEGVCDECGSKIHQREDDTRETIAKRLHKFHEYNNSLVRELEQRGQLIIIDGEKDIQEIHQEIIDKI